MPRDLPRLPQLFTRADAARAGLSRHQIDDRVGRRWCALHRGVFCRQSTWDDASAQGRHLLRAAALALAHASDPDLTISHLTAAAVWELPLPLGESWPVQATTPPGRRTPRAAGGTQIQVARMRPADRLRVRGLWVTSPARTVADCLRHGGPSVGVPIGDAALHRGLVTGAQLDDVLAFQDTWPYAVRARRGRQWLAPRESWLESVSFVAFATAGLALPDSQVEVFDGDGVFVARVDFAWLEQGVVGEADGLEKYGLGRQGAAGDGAGGNGAGGDGAGGDEPRLVDVDQARAIVAAEKLRAERLADLGLRVVRWGAGELRRSPEDLTRRIERVRRSWSGDRFTGTFRQSMPPDREPTDCVTPGVHPEMPHINCRDRHSGGNAGFGV